jgi:uncharacterized phage protein (TIGR02220 family)
MSEHLTRLEELKLKFTTNQSLPAPDISWLITHLEKCYSDQDVANDDLKFTVHEVIAHLNQRSGASYRTDSTSTLRFVRGRYNEGYRLEDYIKVIDTKCKQWKGTDMAKYIRPSTLFAKGHFEEYLQESKMDGPKEIEFSERPSI